MTTPWMRPYLQDPVMMMGMLLERSDATLRELEQINDRLQEGDVRMGEITERLSSLEASAKAPKAGEHIPSWERLTKQAIPYLIGGLTLILTGSGDLALKILSAGLGAAK